mmetsp:Transcript_37585/g.77185  ORF Transcript_37585/g.77185 Transcript_37585/m.77185 type:complete len:397 (+) Transcript_37585:290-1480(+)
MSKPEQEPEPAQRALNKLELTPAEAGADAGERGNADDAKECAGHDTDEHARFARPRHDSLFRARTGVRFVGMVVEGVVGVVARESEAGEENMVGNKPEGEESEVLADVQPCAEKKRERALCSSTRKLQKCSNAAGQIGDPEQAESGECKNFVHHRKWDPIRAVHWLACVFVAGELSWGWPDYEPEDCVDKPEGEQYSRNNRSGLPLIEEPHGDPLLLRHGLRPAQVHEGKAKRLQDGFLELILAHRVSRSHDRSGELSFLLQVVCSDSVKCFDDLHLREQSTKLPRSSRLAVVADINYCHPWRKRASVLFGELGVSLHRNCEDQDPFCHLDSIGQCNDLAIDAEGLLRIKVEAIRVAGPHDRGHPCSHKSVGKSPTNPSSSENYNWGVVFLDIFPA